MSKPRLRWKRDAPETGLARIGAAPRGYIYHDGSTEYAWVSACGGGWHSAQRGWYWVALEQPGLPLENTCRSPVATVEEAKRDAERYCKAHILAMLGGSHD